MNFGIGRRGGDLVVQTRVENETDGVVVRQVQTDVALGIVDFGVKIVSDIDVAESVDTGHVVAGQAKGRIAAADRCKGQTGGVVERIAVVHVGNVREVSHIGRSSETTDCIMDAVAIGAGLASKIGKIVLAIGHYAPGRRQREKNENQDAEDSKIHRALLNDSI
jgi:hypothetical protein